MNRLKLIKGDLLIATNRGFIKMSEIKKEDLIIVVDGDKYYYDNIDDIEKIYKKKYKLNKISFVNNFENYYMNDNIQIKSIKNLPLNLETPEIPDYLIDNYLRCMEHSSISSLSSFDFIGFPLNLNLNIKVDSDINKYKYLGILFYLKINNKIIEDIKENKEIYDFMINYNDKSVEISEITLENIFLWNKDDLLAFTEGLISIHNEINIKIVDINNFLIIKYAFILNGLICNSYFKDGIITIKLPMKWKTDKKLLSNTYFISNNWIWNKIRNIKKIDYNGYLYNLKVNSNKPYLTEIGFIS